MYMKMQGGGIGNARTNTHRQRCAGQCPSNRQGEDRRVVVGMKAVAVVRPPSLPLASAHD